MIEQKYLARAVFAGAVMLMGACATLSQLAALRRVEFALNNVHGGRLAGVPLERIASYRDLSALDVGRLTLAAARKDLPLEMTLNVRADNPSDNRTAATMVRLNWTLLLDNKETITGVLDTAVTMPPGQGVMIPLSMQLNLIDFFGGSAESLLNLAAGLAGLNADPTRVTLRATPTINTPIGPMTYPSPIIIASRTVGVGR